MILVYEPESVQPLLDRVVVAAGPETTIHLFKPMVLSLIEMKKRNPFGESALNSTKEACELVIDWIFEMGIPIWAPKLPHRPEWMNHIAELLAYWIAMYLAHFPDPVRQDLLMAAADMIRDHTEAQQGA